MSSGRVGRTPASQGHLRSLPGMGVPVLVSNTFMGQIKFQVSSELLTSNRILSTIHMIGFDGSIWPCRTEITGVNNSSEGVAGLIVHRNVTQSGRLFLLFPFKSVGEMLVGTGTLIQRESPYQLEVELARGTLNRLRNQLSVWEEGGLIIPTALSKAVIDSQTLLSKSLFDPACGSCALESLELATKTIFDLTEEFGNQVVEFRKSSKTPRKILFAVEDGEYNPQLIEKLTRANTTLVPAGLSCCLEPDSDETFSADNWLDHRELESAIRQFTIIGPLVNARPHALPEWLQSMDNFEQRRQAILDVIQKTVDLADQRCNLVHAIAGMNGVGHKHLSYSQQLQLAIDIIQIIEANELNLPIMVSFDQPWGERLAWSVGGGQSLQIADTLLRHGCRIDALGLEINLDYWPNGSLPREPTQWTELLDFWSHFGLPMMIFLRMPVNSSPIHQPTDRRLPKKQTILGTMSLQQKVDFTRSILPLLFARPNIQGVFWLQSEENGIFPQSRFSEAVDGDTTILDTIAITLDRWQI